MRFDWYSATIGERPDVAALAIATRLKAGLEPTRGAYGYTNGFDIVTGQGVVARLLGGGVNIWPNAWSSGENTGPFVAAVRAEWPDNHHVTRMDTCEDLHGNFKTWNTLYKKLTAIADKHRLVVRHDGDYYRGERGRTLYLGSQKSPCCIRMYEKGKQLRTQNPGLAEQYPENWIRVEAQLRNRTSTRELAATWTPQEAWGFSNASAEVAQVVMGLNAERVDSSMWKKSDDERSLEFMAGQYKNMLGRYLVRSADGWRGVGELIGKTIRRIEVHGKKKKDEPFN